MANNYAVNYDDKRFTQVESDKKVALSELEQTYTGMIDKSDKFYQDQADNLDKYKAEQTKIQNEQTDFAIQKIEQQKDKAQKDYIREQSGAYADWRKQSNEYGAEAEKMASQGLANTGYSESSQVSMYNTYQNRVAAARETINQVAIAFDNDITQARLQNSAALAELAFETQQKKLELALEGFQYKNQLILEKANKKTELENIYYNRYQDVLAQINQENALAEEVRQYNESLALQKAQLEEEKRQYNATLAFQKQQYADSKKTASIDKSRSNAGRRYIEVGNEKIAKPAVAKKTTAMEYLTKLIRSGASKDKVMNEINLARSRGVITKEEALKLGNTFAPRGMQY